MNLKQKWENLKYDVKRKTYYVVEWGKENKDELMVLIPIIGAGLLNIIKVSVKRNNLKEERALKERFVYDRSNGHYYELRRKLRNSEWIQIEQRRKSGESLGLILIDMGVLK